MAQTLPLQMEPEAPLTQPLVQSFPGAGLPSGQNMGSCPTLRASVQPLGEVTLLTAQLQDLTERLITVPPAPPTDSSLQSQAHELTAASSSLSLQTLPPPS